MIKRTITRENRKDEVVMLRDIELHNSPMGDLLSSWPALNAVTLEVGGSDARTIRFERPSDDD